MNTVDELAASLDELHFDETLKDQQPMSCIDAVVVSHEFTDHCHQATLMELPASILVLATDKAAELIRSWSHFDTVITMPGLTAADSGSWQTALHNKTTQLPEWLSIGRVVTEGNALCYHSAIAIVFDLDCGSDTTSESQDMAAEAFVYSPHGIKGSDLEWLGRSRTKTLALLHGLHDVRIWMTAQWNLGALNGIKAIRASGAKYWIAAHDEIKKGGGFISWLLRRTVYALRDAIGVDEVTSATGDVSNGRPYRFLQLGSGDGIVLE